MKQHFKIGLKIPNPFFRINIWFFYNPIFWKLKPIKVRVRGFSDYDSKDEEMLLIRHIITGKICNHTSWGKEITKNSIFNVNSKYELMS